jgi:hypothetical protein
MRMGYIFKNYNTLFVYTLIIISIAEGIKDYFRIIFWLIFKTSSFGFKFNVTSCYFAANIKGYFKLFLIISGGNLFTNLGVILYYFYNGISG